MTPKPYIPRLITNRLKQLAKHFPSLVIVGARQVGKSTLVQHIFPEYSYVQFDPYVDVENARKDPELFLKNRPPPLILDEIQYAPEVVATLKRKIDLSRKPGQYILTGSQHWGVIKQMAESLAGRTVISELESFSLSEIADQQPDQSWLTEWLKSPSQFIQRNKKLLSLDKVPYELLWSGFMPEVQTLPQNLVQSYHDTYQKTYIEKDIRLLAEIPDLHQFTRFVRLSAALTAQEINYNQLGRDLGIANQTAKRWLMLLKAIFEWNEIPAFSKNTIKKISLKPKGFFADTGQICFCQAISSPQSLGDHPLRGAIFETAVVQEIRKHLSWISESVNLYHWRSHGGAECDLILEQNGKYYPIEIKTKTNPTRADIRGISAFRKTYPKLSIERGLVICLADSFYQLSENDYAIPWDLSILM